MKYFLLDIHSRKFLVGKTDDYVFLTFYLNFHYLWTVPLLYIYIYICVCVCLFSISFKYEPTKYLKEPINKTIINFVIIKINKTFKYNDKPLKKKIFHIHIQVFIIMIQYFPYFIIRMTIPNYKFILINIYQFEAKI